MQHVSLVPSSQMHSYKQRFSKNVIIFLHVHKIWTMDHIQNVMKKWETAPNVIDYFINGDVRVRYTWRDFTPIKTPIESNL